MSDRPLIDGWHLRKEVTAGNIVATVVAVITMTFFFADQDKRIDLNKQAIDAVRATALEREDRMVRAMGRLEAALIRIESKLDTKEDKGK
jgi:hypothetical protein